MEENTQKQEYKDIPEQFLKPYNPAETEKRIYELWEQSGFFNPDTCIEKGVTKPDAQPFTIIMPPPNATGTLHMGHALGLTIQDIFTRYKRMNGFRTLLLPGTDHASIATQSKVEKEIQKSEKKSRHDLGREEMLRRIDTFVEGSRNTITEQTKVMGTSCDWSREAFTLDTARNITVNTLFKKMYDDRLIYRGHRIVNWDPKGQTTIADDEIVYEEEKTKLYYFKYGPFTIGTARPETKFGDKYVVMHPADTRYSDYKHGDTMTVEWINGPIETTIIKDEIVDMEFGTGVMTITPWHSVVDFELAEKHKLDKEQIIDFYGKLLPIAGEFAGMKIKDARPKIVEKLARKGLLVDKDGNPITIDQIENYTHNIATAERTGGIIEPQIKLQWFVAVNKQIPGKDKTLKDIMREAVADKKITILPEYFDKTYFHWIENLRDWCISRQIWYGHRVPVWYRGDEIYCGVVKPEGDGWVQDEDTLDTWFSSGTWTFSTLGWPNSTKDLEIYHPTSVMIHAYEILFFWSARMILMTGYALNTIPFHTLYLTGVIRDNQGRKFSKSLGNGIDPIEVADKFGTDAGRIALIIGTAPGTDSKIDENKIKGYKNFANKVWNITRFILSNTVDVDLSVQPALSIDEEKILAEFHTVISDITADIENYRLHLASEKTYHYIWHTLADEIIEQSKEILKSENTDIQYTRSWMLMYILENCLKMLHPFMPFVTEEIWGLLPENTGSKNKQLLMVTQWPQHE